MLKRTIQCEFEYYSYKIVNYKEELPKIKRLYCKVKQSSPSIIQWNETFSGDNE